MVAEFVPNPQENSSEKNHNIILPDAIYSRQQLSWLCSWMTLIRWEQDGKLKRIGRGRIVRYRGCDLLAALQAK